jgi:N-ethylmaleimide reductase
MTTSPESRDDAADAGSLLFTPIRVGAHRLPHRAAMAPMTRNRAGEGNAPTEMNAEYYAQRASAALIVTEATQVSPRGVGYPSTPGIHTDEQVEGWRLVTDAVHDRDGRIFLQLWHVGRISHPSLQPDGGRPVAPSAVEPEGEAQTYEGPKPFVTPRALETEEVPQVVEEFREGARRALEAGFDGVEIHGANGYLVDQFLRDGTNRRTDRWGGPVENRARFLLEVTEAAADVWGADRVGVRLSPLSGFNDMSDSDPGTTFGHAAARLDELGLAYLHVVEPDPGEAEGRPEPGSAADRERPAAVRGIREAFSGPLMANNAYDRASAGRAIEEEFADLVSFGRLFLANPDLPERFAEGAPLNEPDPSTFYGGGEEGYTDYPTLEELAEAREA